MSNQDATPKALQQEALQQLHETIAHLIAHHGSGIITDLEFVYAVGSAGVDAKLAFYKAQQPIHKADLTGLIDVNTGLKY
jgi:hypothetical protein